MFSSIITNNIDISSMLIIFLSSIILGIIIALMHIKTTKYSKNIAITLATLPLLVSVVIIMVNGNLGTGIAVVGAFSLVRFRSIPGNSREITSIFFAMAVGLSLGTGYIGYAFIITIVGSLSIYLLSISSFGSKENYKILRITIPEELDYTNIFDDVFLKYTKKISLDKIKTTNLGSLFELTYHVIINKNEKEFLDDLRCRNGNLKIILEREMIDETEL